VHVISNIQYFNTGPSHFLPSGLILLQQKKTIINSKNKVEEIKKLTKIKQETKN